MVLIPCMGASGVVRMRMTNGACDIAEGLDGGARAGGILGGALNGVSTVTAFNMQQSIAEHYSEVRERKTASFVHPEFKYRCQCSVLYASSVSCLVFDELGSAFYLLPVSMYLACFPFISFRLVNRLSRNLSRCESSMGTSSPSASASDRVCCSSW